MWSDVGGSTVGVKILEPEFVEVKIVEFLTVEKAPAQWGLFFFQRRRRRKIFIGNSLLSHFALCFLWGSTGSF